MDVAIVVWQYRAVISTAGCIREEVAQVLHQADEQKYLYRQE
jgi:hypothetical protein